MVRHHQSNSAAIGWSLRLQLMELCHRAALAARRPFPRIHRVPGQQSAPAFKGRQYLAPTCPTGPSVLAANARLEAVFQNLNLGPDLDAAIDGRSFMAGVVAGPMSTEPVEGADREQRAVRPDQLAV